MTVTFDGMNLQKDYLSEWVEEFSTNTVAGSIPE
jgi:hypothetical protein